MEQLLQMTFSALQMTEVDSDAGCEDLNPPT